MITIETVPIEMIAVRESAPRAANTAERRHTTVRAFCRWNKGS
jgi:hypothetical protein